MKYTIHGFQQDKLVEQNLSCEEALLLSTIKDAYFSPSVKKILVDGVQMAWLNYGYLADYLQIVGSKRKIRRMVSTLCENGFLRKEIQHNKDGIKGTYMYIIPTEKTQYLMEYSGGVDKIGGGGGQNWHPGWSEVAPKHSSNNSSSIYNTIYAFWNEEAEKNSEAMTVHRELTTAMKKAIDKAIKNLGKDIDYKLLISHFLECHKKSGKMSKRTLQEFFGQRSYQKDWLICEDFTDEGSTWLYWKNKGASQQVAIPGVTVVDSEYPEGFEDY